MINADDDKLAPYYTVKEAAALARVTDKTVRNWIRSGQLGVRHAGARVLIPAAALKSFIR